MKTYVTPETLPKYGSVKTIVDSLGRSEDVLDVGCSEGYLARYDGGNNRFWGIDANGEALEVARPYYIEVVQADLNSNGDWFADRQFDVVVFADVLEHLLRPEVMLRKAAGWLKPSGRILVSSPNVALWRVRFNLLLGRFDYAKYGVLDDTHLHFYTFASARRLLEENGFNVERVDGAANGLGFLARKIRPLRNLASINVVMCATPARPL